MCRASVVVSDMSAKNTTSVDIIVISIRIVDGFIFILV